MTPILETIFSLIFIFLVFSLINSWIVEFIAARLQERGKMLRQFVVDALDDKFNKNWGLLLYAHPLIDVLHREVKLPKGFKGLFHNNKLNVKRKLPAYIPSEQFATALIDLVIHHNQVTRFVRNPVTGKYELAQESPPITDAAGTIIPNGSNNMKRSFSDFLDGLHSMKESEVKTTLSALARHITASDGVALNQLTTAIATWYDSGMERLNGWYKRKIRFLLFGVGLIVAICFNVDTIKVTSRLYSDPQMRTAVAAAAEQFLKEHQELPSDSVAVDLNALSKRIDSLKAVLDPLNLPIGWKLPQVTEQRGNLLQTSWEKIRALFSLQRNNITPLSFLGWILTAFALSFGAPFWFDALKRISNVRSAGLRPTPRSLNNDPDKK